jgi:hypothetical protein
MAYPGTKSKVTKIEQIKKFDDINYVLVYLEKCSKTQIA